MTPQDTRHCNEIAGGKKEDTFQVKRHDVHLDAEYHQWLAEIKARYQTSQTRAAVKINAEKLLFNWQLGRDITVRKPE